MIKIFNEILRNKLTPNEFYILYCMIERQDLNVHSIDDELKSLKSKGFLDNQGMYTDKAVQVVKQVETSGAKKKYVLTEDDLNHIAQYRELFPKGNLPSGQPARVNIKDLQKRFAWFLTQYQYSWETILAATTMYIDKYKTDGFRYMKTSGYFIFKQEKGEEPTSQLANFCDMVLEGEDTPSLPAYSSHTVL